MPIPADQIDPDARKVIRRLVKHGYQAYLVGGCVRDLLLGRTPKDFDIATSATPNEVKSLFRNCRIIGRRFRLAHIFFGPKIIETATFRANPRECEPDDADEGLEPRDENDLLIRRDNVFGTAEEDARRRDFTINGLFYDIENDEVIDYVGGLNDLAARLVRTIGDPDIRFREDPVRILRAIKFAARLGFDIDETAWKAIREHRGEIPKCAAPRVLEEIYRLLRGGAARRSIELLRDTGVLQLLLPEVAERLEGRPDSVEASAFWTTLGQIDALRDRVPSNAVLLCVLLAPLVGETVWEEPAPTGGRARDLGLYLEERTRGMLDRMRVARRDIERARQILLTQRRIAPSRRRRGRVANLARRDWFEEALQVFELVGMSLRPVEGAEEEISYLRRAHHGEEPESLPPGAADDGAVGLEAPNGGRRRRRRRRRGERGLPAQGELFRIDDGARESGQMPEPLAPAELAALPVEAAQASDAPPSTGSTTPER